MAEQIQKTISISEALNERIKMTEEDLQKYKSDLDTIKFQESLKNNPSNLGKKHLELHFAY